MSNSKLWHHRALHIIQKIMSRPDAEQVFHQFDADKSGTVRIACRITSVPVSNDAETLATGRYDSLMAVLG